eukprot:452556-Amphidinium_carterae.1
MKRWLLVSSLSMVPPPRGQRNLTPTVTRTSTTVMTSKRLRKTLVIPVTMQDAVRSRRTIRAGDETLM